MVHREWRDCLRDCDHKDHPHARAGIKAEESTEMWGCCLQYFEIDLPKASQRKKKLVQQTLPDLIKVHLFLGLGVLNSMLGPTYPPISCASLLAQDWCPT